MFFQTEDNVAPEIMLHSDYISWLNKRNVIFKAWGSAGPDFLLPEYNCIGEVKKEDSITQLKLAVKELYERKKPEFVISRYNSFFIICGSTIRVYTQTNHKQWDDVDLSDCVIFNAKDRDLFLKYISKKSNKLLIEDNLKYALDFVLDERFGMCVSDSLRLLFNLDDENMLFVNNGIYLHPGTKEEIYIALKCEKDIRQRLSNFIKTFTIKDPGVVKDYIKHNYSSHLPDSKKANLGKYYTPLDIVQKVKHEIEDKITENTFVLDLSCGCGAFLELFDDCHIIGRDIDPQAIEILDLFNFPNIGIDNSLLNVSRSKYGITEDEDLIIIGNPPYNDTSSINKRYSTKAKNTRAPEDKDIKRRDIGRSFLEAYAKLNPRYICVLHPLAFLIKRSNFNELKFLKENYVLENATVFKSTLFKDLYGSTPFPIVIATYKRSDIGMDYEFIKNFVFSIHGSTNKFTLGKINLAGHDYIHQTVTSVDTQHESDIGLYHYNFRDMNSLNKANFKNSDYRSSHMSTMLVVNYKDLWKYCYVNCIKKFLLPLLCEEDNYILGNLNPIIRTRDLEANDPYWRDLFIICSILKNTHRIDCFNIENRNTNILTKKFMINDYIRRSKQLPAHRYNFYRDFLEYIECGEDDIKERIYNFVQQYFVDLISSCFTT